MMSEKKVPAIRFRGFEDDWEQRKLSNITDIVGGGTPSTSNPDYWEGDIDWYTPAEIGEQIFAYGSVRKITKEGLIHSSAKILPAHKTVLFTSRAGIGNMAILKRPAATNQGFQSLVCHDDIDPYFMFSMGDSIKAKAERVAAGSTFAEISGKKLGELEFMFPDTDEQKAIGAYFKNLDYLITLHQRKLEKLKIVKKSMLVNCFPKNDEKVPKFRFSGFTGDWEQRKLGDFGYVAMCKRIFKDQTAESGDIPFYKIGTFGGEPDAYISRDLFKEYKHLYSYPEKGDILISASGSIGRTVEYTGEDAYYQDSNIVWLKHDKTIVNSFLKHLYEVIRWSGIEGSTIKRLYNDNILKTEVMIPAAPEQEEIGKCFNNLDNLITLHQRELKKLQMIKKSMLRSMFV